MSNITPADNHVTGNLRQDPKPTQVFQPDMSSSRQIRYPRPTVSPPPVLHLTQTYHTASADPRNPAFSLDKYEPRQPIALTLRPVTTPGNNPELFSQQKAIAKAATLPKPPPQPNRHLRRVITGPVNGPNIYLRCLYGLRSGIRNEQEFALHHLVKVSFERGDKFKFEGFPILAESLIEKALEISLLVHDIKWKINYDPEEDTTSEPNTLNAAFGTPHIRERLKGLAPVKYLEGLTNPDNQQTLSKLNEVALVLRNMIMLEENAAFISKMRLFRDFLLICLNLPDQPETKEFRNYTLEMTEYATRYWRMAPDDPVFLTLLDFVDSDDRANIISALRAICRIGMDTDHNQDFSEVEPATIDRLVAFCLLDVDDDLVSTAIDFLYQYTASTDNLNFILRQNSSFAVQIIPRFVQLLTFNAIDNKERILVRPAQGSPRNETIPDFPAFLFQQIVHMSEPERASRYLRCCFEEAPQADITQIAIWQAYQGTFRHDNHMVAPDFIKHVSTTFAGAQAQVINGPNPKFIIKGIRPRRTLHDLSGRPLLRCEWEKAKLLFDHPTKHLCGQWQRDREGLWNHLVSDHMGFKRDERGAFRNGESGQYACQWLGCDHRPMLRAQEAAQHLKLHVPKSAEEAARSAETAGIKDAEYTEHTWWNTAVDERGHPCGVPYMSALVLKNMARYALRNMTAQHSHHLEERRNMMEDFFGPVKASLWHALTVNRVLAGELADLLQIIKRGEAPEAQKRVEDGGNTNDTML